MNSIDKVKFHHIHLNVDDVNHINSLFEEVGSTNIIQNVTVGTKEILQINFNGVKVFLSPTSEELTPGIDHIGISTSAIQETCEKFLRAGWEQIDSKKLENGLEAKFLKSSEGIVIEVLEVEEVEEGIE